MGVGLIDFENRASAKTYFFHRKECILATPIARFQKWGRLKPPRRKRAKRHFRFAADCISGEEGFIILLNSLPVVLINPRLAAPRGARRL